MKAKISGTRMANSEVMVEITSSARLTGILPAPAVVAVTAGRTATALTVCTLPATSRPAARAITRVDFCQYFGAGSKDDCAGNRADEGLQQVIHVIDCRYFIGEKFDRGQHDQQPDDPRAGEGIPGRLQVDQIGEAGQERDYEQGYVGVQPRAGRKTKSGDDAS